jgi:glyoxylase I family protein
MVFSHVALTCKDQKATERYYTDHFGFKRAAVFDIGGGNQLVFIKSGNVYLELFPGAEDRAGAAPAADGGGAQGVRHIAFQVENADATIAAMGDAAKITLGRSILTGLSPAGALTGLPILTGTSLRSARDSKTKLIRLHLSHKTRTL